VIERPRVGISRCLLGDVVRYDGGHKHNRMLAETLGRYVEWVPVCPEVETGMGTPREPINLISSRAGVTSGEECVRLIALQSGHDWTEVMHDYARNRARELATLRLSGFVFKKDSPSCGLEGVTVQHEDGRLTATGRGLFAQALIDAMPDLPVEEEDTLGDARVRQHFIERVIAYHRMKCQE
jgi:uncharacterized protein YbbK (DUF523 family)